MCSLGLLRKELLSIDTMWRLAKSSYSMNSSLQKIYYVTKYNHTISKPTTIMLQQFSTTKPLMSSHGTTHWQVERLISLALLGMMPAVVMCDCEVLEAATSSLITIHIHWGLLHIQSDYLKPSNIGDALATLSIILVYAISIFTLAGLLNITYTQNGIGRAVRTIWTL